MRFSKKYFKSAAPAIILASAVAYPAASFADAESESNNRISKEKGIAMGTTAAVGAAVGGPVGLFAGIIVGALIGDAVDTKNELVETEEEMNIATKEIYQLEDQISQLDLVLDDMQIEVAALEETLLTRLEFQVLFRTGDDRLQESDRERIAMLANYMRQNKEVIIKLEGHTDARGTDAYNSVLAEQRALSVANALFARGIATDRVIVESKGATEAGDYEGYALDRRVNIEVLGKKAEEDALDENNLVEAQSEQSELALVE